MLKALEQVEQAQVIDDTLTLPFDLRQRSRLVAQLASGREILIQLTRGNVLRHGVLLRTNEGSTIQVLAAPEPLSVVSHSDPTALARAAYHLGNRHVPLQIGQSSLCYRQDHVLDDMLRGLGLIPEHVERPFEPEQGAYAQTGHGAHSSGTEHSRHGHAHDSDHEH